MLSSKSIGSVHGGAREPAAYRKTQASHLLVESILGNTQPLDAYTGHGGLVAASRNHRQPAASAGAAGASDLLPGAPEFGDEQSVGSSGETPAWRRCVTFARCRPSRAFEVVR